MTPSDHPQDDLLIADALRRHYYRLEDADPNRANRAHELAVEIVRMHGLELCELERQIEGEYPP